MIFHPAGRPPEHERWMEKALELAAAAAADGEVPVGAVVVEDGRIVGRGGNRPVGASDPTAHAEILALREAARRRRNYRLPGTALYVTIEPCTMCVGAMIHARVGLLVFGAREPRAGAVVSHQRLPERAGHNHRLDHLEGVLAGRCRDLMQAFFQARRAKG